MKLVVTQEILHDLSYFCDIYCSESQEYCTESIFQEFERDDKEAIIRNEDDQRVNIEPLVKINGVPQDTPRISYSSRNTTDVTAWRDHILSEIRRQLDIYREELGKRNEEFASEKEFTI